VLANGVEPGLIYTAVADVVQPTPEELRNEPSTPSAEAVRNTATPDVPEVSEVQALAEKWTLGQTTVYDKIIAIQDRFTDPKWGFGYDDTVPASTSDDAMLEFLRNTRTGFCQQFASSMAVMLRTLGIPARLAVGFTPGEPAGSSDRLTVTTKNAHAWVEVLFPSFGWVPFEPTPNRQNVVAYPYLDPDAAERCDGPRCEPSGGPRRARLVGPNVRPIFWTSWYGSSHTNDSSDKSPTWIRFPQGSRKSHRKSGCNFSLYFFVSLRLTFSIWSASRTIRPKCLTRSGCNVGTSKIAMN
jgi:hypothetical protein